MAGARTAEKAKKKGGGMLPAPLELTGCYEPVRLRLPLEPGAEPELARRLERGEEAAARVVSVPEVGVQRSNARLDEHAVVGRILVVEQVEHVGKEDQSLA